MPFGFERQRVKASDMRRQLRCPVSDTHLSGLRMLYIGMRNGGVSCFSKRRAEVFGLNCMLEEDENLEIDIWQMMGSLAALAFTVGFVDQLRITFKTRNVEGLSLLQWMMFTAASSIFTAYYAHLDQWMMVAVSVFGTLCCLTIIGMIFRYRKVAE